MNIVCPHCNFSKPIDPARIPQRPVRVSCPKCGQGFSFDKSAQNPTEAQQATAPPDQISCPVCGLVQVRRERCQGCGVIYHKLQAQRDESARQEAETDALHDGLAALRQKVLTQTPQALPKAGFWVRAVASLLDSFLLAAVQFLLSLLIGLTIGMLGMSADGDPAVNTVIWLFGASLSIGYAVFFIGYCGQTPGKMALRIKVIRTDGSQIGYGRAALREVPGKFISTILFGIGYLMVAFDSQKQGLHDKIADTYVIKL